MYLRGVSTWDILGLLQRGEKKKEKKKKKRAYRST